MKLPFVVNTSQLQVFRGILKGKKSFLPVYNEVTAQLNKKMEGFDFVVDKWPDFSSVIIKANPREMKFDYLKHTYSVCSESDESLTRLLTYCDIVRSDKETTVQVFTGKSLHAVTKWLDQENVTYSVCNPNIWMHVTPSEFKYRSISSEGLTFRRLNPDQSELVNSFWEYSNGEASNLYIKHLISTQPSCCLYTQDDQLIGWVLMYHYGWPGFVHVLSRFRGKGYATLLMSQHIKEHFDSGNEECKGTVEESNSAAIKLYRSLGGSVVPDVKTFDVVCKC